MPYIPVDSDIVKYNDTTILVSEAGTYTVVYYHPADPSTILYSVDTNITEDILDELTGGLNLSFELQITEVKKKIYFRNITKSTIRITHLLYI